jgi:uncharacterized CHY-type Zn-finger protein
MPRKAAEQYLLSSTPEIYKHAITEQLSVTDVFYVVLPEAASGQRLGKHDLALTYTNATIEERCFLCGPCREVITRTDGATSSILYEIISCKSAAVKTLCVV